MKTTENAARDWWVANHTTTSPSWDRDYIRARATMVVCADGFDVSLQASHAHYCEPQTYLADGEYSAWELGFPSAPDDLITPFAENKNDLTGTVYPWVPTRIVNELIAKHGGLRK